MEHPLISLLISITLNGLFEMDIGPSIPLLSITIKKADSFWWLSALHQLCFAIWSFNYLLIILFSLSNRMPQRVPFLKKIHEFISKYILVQNMWTPLFIPIYWPSRYYKEIHEIGTFIPIPNFISVLPYSEIFVW